MHIVPRFVTHCRQEIFSVLDSQYFLHTLSFTSCCPHLNLVCLCQWKSEMNSWGFLGLTTHVFAHRLHICCRLQLCKKILSQLNGIKIHFLWSLINYRCVTVEVQIKYLSVESVCDLCKFFCYVCINLTVSTFKLWIRRLI